MFSFFFFLCLIEKKVHESIRVCAAEIVLNVGWKPFFLSCFVRYLELDCFSIEYDFLFVLSFLGGSSRFLLIYLKLT